MAKLRNIACAAMLALTPAAAFAECESNVDKVEVLYINGMFNDIADFITNHEGVRAFMDTFFSGELSYGV